MPFITLGIDGFLLMIEVPADPLGKESLRSWGFGLQGAQVEEALWERGRFEDNALKPRQGSEREQVGNGRRPEI